MRIISLPGQGPGPWKRKKTGIREHAGSGVQATRYRKQAMRRILLLTTLLFSGVTAASQPDIWVSLFQEKLKEAVQGDVDAQYETGAMYQNGRGTPTDRKRAIEWFQKAAEQGHQQSILRLARMESNQKRFERELKLAESGNMESQYSVGTMYANGTGVDVDLEQARQWYTLAAEQGHEKAEYKLGYLYYRELGDKTNVTEAFKWFSMAARKGNAPAQFYLGRMYADGEAVSKNHNQALKWLRLSMEGGFDQAREEMNRIEDSMNKPDQSREQARKKTAAAPAPKASASSSDRPVTGKDTHNTVQATTTLQSLERDTWLKNGKPAGILPSSINQCISKDSTLVCHSDRRKKSNSQYLISYKSRSVIRKSEQPGSFTVAYRNLVLDVKQRPDEEYQTAIESAFGDEAEQGFKVKTGWSIEHVLQCNFANPDNIVCKKDNGHKNEFTRQEILVGKR